MSSDPNAAFAVVLHVYDLSQGTARALSQPFLGFAIDIIPHTGIEVHGLEIFFGGGVQRMDHRAVVRQFGLVPVRSNALGTTSVTRDALNAYLASVDHRFTQATYDVFHNNCNHFSDAVARYLLNGQGIPEDIVGLPRRVLASPMGQMLGGMMQNMQQQMIPFNQPPAAAAMPIPAVPVPTVPVPTVPVSAVPVPTVLDALKQLEAKTPDHKTGYLAVRFRLLSCNHSRAAHTPAAVHAEPDPGEH
jgi:hypothetical protein